MKTLALTASFGGMDAIHPFPDQTDAQCDYIAVTEKRSPFPLGTLNPRMQARYFKTQMHRIWPGYDVYVWLDANIQIKSSGFITDITAPIATGQAQIAMARHPERDCIYDEARFIKDGVHSGNAYLKERYALPPILLQTARYLTEGHPEHFGLWWCGLFARVNNDWTNRFFDRWWEECVRWSNNDQIAFAWLARVFDIKIHAMTWGDFNHNAVYRRHKHLKLQ